MRLVFLGRPGAGKGTQAVKFAQARGLAHVSTGDMLREGKSPAAQRAKTEIDAIMKRGGLVPDDIVLPLVEERLDTDGKNGFILDGYPRNVRQAEDLEKLLAKHGVKLDAAVDFDIPEHVIVPRMVGRRSCPKCGRVYNVTLNPPKKDNVCDVDGTALIQRKDDTEDVVKKRMAEYRANTAPLGPFYEKRGLLVKVDADGPVDEVARRLEKALAARAGKR